MPTVSVVMPTRNRANSADTQIRSRRPLRIALFHNCAGRGPKRAIYHFAKELVRRGHHIDLYVLSTANEDFLPLKDLGVTQKTFEAPRRGQVKWLRPYLLERYVESAKRIKWLTLYERTLRVVASDIEAGAYDVVWVDNCWITETPFILRHLNTPTLVYCHEPKRDWFEDQRLRRWTAEQGPGTSPRWYMALCDTSTRLEHWYLRRVARKNIAAATRILTNSQHTRDYISAAYGSEAMVSRLGVDTMQFKPLGLPREHVVLTVGHLEKWERLEMTIQAVGLIPNGQRPHLTVVLPTRAHKRLERLTSLAQSLQVQLRIESGLPDEALVNWYNRAGVVVCTGLRESFGLVAIEAMACGTPVIGVREGGLQESIQHGQTGLLVDPTPKDLATSIQTILENPALQDRMGRGGIAAVKAFWTWESAAGQFEEHLYNTQRHGHLSQPT